MRKTQPSPLICPNCHKAMKLMLVKETGCPKLRCGDCGQPDPLQSADIQGWLNGEFGLEKPGRLNSRHCEELFWAMAD
jgi:hypothetical protein